jgi:O-antigen ligase
VLDFQHFVLNTHQIFLGLLVLVFSFFMVQDLQNGSPLPLPSRRFLVVFFAVFTVGVFATYLEDWGQRGLFLAMHFALLVSFSILHPKYAISFLIFLFLSRPWESFENQMMSSVPRDISILTILSMLGHKLIKKQYYFRFNPGTLLVLAFAFWIFLSALFSNHSDEALFAYEEIFSKGIILFILIQNCLETDEDMLPVKTGFVLSILEKCFVSFYKSNMMNMPTIVEDSHARLESVGILSNSNDIAAIFVLAIPFAIFFIIKTNLRPLNWFLAALTGLAMFILVWQSASRGALLGIFAIIGTFALIRIKSRKLLILTAALGLVGTLGSFSLMNRGEGDLEGSTSNRLLFWEAGLNMAIRNPILGVGYNGFPKNFPAYAPNGNVGTEKEHMTAHSSWVLAMAEGGLMALGLFALLWLYAAFAAWKIRLTQPEYILGIAGYGLAISFLSHTYLLFPYILLALGITHYQINSKNVLQSKVI